MEWFAENARRDHHNDFIVCAIFIIGVQRGLHAWYLANSRIASGGARFGVCKQSHHDRRLAFHNGDAAFERVGGKQDPHRVAKTGLEKLKAAIA